MKSHTLRIFVPGTNEVVEVQTDNPAKQLKHVMTKDIPLAVFDRWKPFNKVNSGVRYEIVEHGVWP